MLFVNEMEDGKLKDCLLKTFASFNEKKDEHEGIRNALLWMVRAAEKAKALDKGLIQHGYSTNPYGEIFECVSDAVYHLTGEQAIRFEDSKTYILLHTDAITDQYKVSLLLDEYKKNRPALM